MITVHFKYTRCFIENMKLRFNFNYKISLNLNLIITLLEEICWKRNSEFDIKNLKALNWSFQKKNSETSSQSILIKTEILLDERITCNVSASNRGVADLDDAKKINEKSNDKKLFQAKTEIFNRNTKVNHNKFILEHELNWKKSDKSERTRYGSTCLSVTIGWWPPARW